MSGARFCKDCRFMQRDAPIAPPRPICLHPTSLYQEPQDMVTGKIPRPRQLACDDVRHWTNDTLCGPSGRYWEPRT